ncbi:hypothetical protein GUITHDRAFT_121740 [Guillardia theta CCMP2712]|uniref:Copine C-terminal domain-containing protein n=1 Tax=Guillardia theta (strain CCMP2712) TaxID=905079 RepID=L1I7L9_GUITC|nr:hypothetical protein GUITHDRAFT_121740 [Guillardia theta CCMP2712]EKX32087.1 hypothetical protein GUITHDRAFT_121740 [Guillardia theta CCMP2712]|eukprot:XP_005819067.1 hypothetical protein GUITHDRAFT_121740 [Guillardia theta CCMP2712]
MLILTDGEICDLPNTTEEIIKCSSLPISIIIVGVGKGNFGKMEKLDSDDSLLKGKGGNRAERDVVQFVPFRKYSGNRAGEQLSEAVLAEMPYQLLAYMCKNRVKPAVNWPFELPNEPWVQ